MESNGRRVGALLVLIGAAACGGSGASTYAAPSPGDAGSARSVVDAAAASEDGDAGASLDDASSATDGDTDADADGGPTADIPAGPPVMAPDGVWTNVPVPQGYCRDGAPAHMMVHLNSASKKVAIYEEGGGACFNDTSCKLLTFDLPSYALGQGIFNFTRMDNPIRDWNIFYIPYCTGDVQAGDNASAVPGPLTGTTHFSGYTNMKLYLARILGTVPDATDVLLTGSSAGGFGAGLTADLVARNAPTSVQRFTLLDDSGPLMSSTYIPPCLQDTWRKVWGFDNTFLKDCGSACPNSSDYIFDGLDYILKKYTTGSNASKFNGGLISATGDGVMSMFLGFGANKCTTSTPLTSAQFEAGLLDLRSFIAPRTSQFGTFFYGSSAHTTLIMDTGGWSSSSLIGGLYDTQAGGVKLVDWINDLLAHKQATHVGP